MSRGNNAGHRLLAQATDVLSALARRPMQTIIPFARRRGFHLHIAHRRLVAASGTEDTRRLLLLLLSLSSSLRVVACLESGIMLMV